MYYQILCAYDSNHQKYITMVEYGRISHALTISLLE